MNENEPGSKTARYFRNTQDGELPVRKLMGRYVPREVVNREKQGRSAPDSSRFKGESIDCVWREILIGGARINEFLDASVIPDLVEDHLEVHEHRRLLIWSLPDEWNAIINVAANEPLSISDIAGRIGARLGIEVIFHRDSARIVPDLCKLASLTSLTRFRTFDSDLTDMFDV